MALMAFGCSSDVDNGGNGGAGGAGGGTTTTTTVTTTTSGITTTTTTTSTTVDDESTSCTDAVELEAVQNNAGGTFFRGTGVINPAKDADFFKFKATEGEWIGLITQANPDDDPMMIDTVLTLFSEDGKEKLAEVDDAFPRASTDTEIYYRVPKTGTYCVKVWEFSDFSGMDPEGDPSFSYEVDVLPIDAALYEGYDEDTGDNDTQPKAQELSNPIVDAMSGQLFTRIYGLLDPGTDVDWYKFTAPGDALGLSTTFTPSGEDGFGSTGGPGVLTVYDSNGTTKLAVLDYQKGSDGFSAVPIAAGKEYFLSVARPNPTVGANDFYFLKFATTDTLNPQETNDAGNGVSTGAEVAESAMSQNPQTTLHFVGGTIPPGDSDWWTVPTEFPMGTDVTVVCSSQRAGSGVGDMKVEMFEDPAKAAVQSETETDAADVLWSTLGQMPSKPGVVLAKTGKPFLKISSTKLNATGATSTHYLCGFHFTTQ